MVIIYKFSKIDQGFIMVFKLLGTEKERGLAAWNSHLQKEGATIENRFELEKALESYDIPFTKQLISKLKWTKYIPVCPAYKRDTSSLNADTNSAKDVEIQNPGPSTYF